VSELAVEEIDPESWLARQVYAYFGLAMYWAQAIEYGITNVAVATGMRDGAITLQGEVEIDYAGMFSKTMGQARNELLRRCPDLVEFEDKLRRAVKLRNFLAHSYFRHRTSAFMTAEGQEAMIRELQGAAGFLETVNADFEEISLHLVQVMGATEERLAEIYASLREDGFGEPLPGI
jgi:hypothetical protein